MSDHNVFRELDKLIAKAGLRLTFDAGRDITKPCTFCGSCSRPRKLIDIGIYSSGETLTRPVCGPCAERNKARLRHDVKYNL